MEYDAKHLKREQHNTRKERSGGLLCAVFHRVHDRGTKQCGERDEQQQHLAQACKKDFDDVY